MRFLLILLATTTALAQLSRQTQILQHHRESPWRQRRLAKRRMGLRHRGTYLRTTDAGRTWLPDQGPQRHHSRFPRHSSAFSADEAFLMSAGPGDQSRIYHTPTPAGTGNSNSPPPIQILLRLHRLLGFHSTASFSATPSPTKRVN